MTRYEETAACTRCGACVVATVPAFGDSPDPLWRTEDGDAATCSQGGWHVTTADTEEAR